MVRYTWIQQYLHPDTGRIQFTSETEISSKISLVFEGIIRCASNDKFQRATAREIIAAYTQQRASFIRTKLVRRTTEKAVRTWVTFTIVDKTQKGALVCVDDWRNCKHRSRYCGHYWVPTAL